MSTLATPLALRRVRVAGAWLALPAWYLFVHAGRDEALSLMHPGRRLAIGAPPIVGRLDWLPDSALIAAALIAIAAVALAPTLALRARWPIVLSATAALAAGWTYALAASRGGWGAFVAPLQTRYEFLHDVPLVHGAGSLLGGFIASIRQTGPAAHAIHVRGHPPGLLLGLWGLDQAGLGGVTPVAVLVLAAAATTPVLAVVTVRAIADEQSARRAAPFLALAPIALWVGTSSDALFMAVFAAGIALLATARERDRQAVAAGLVLGAGLMLSYGLAPLGLVAIAVAWRRWRALALAAAGVAAVLLAFAIGGFNWFAGLAATREIALAGVQSQRPYVPFLLISLAAFALALGPATAVALASLRDRRLWLVCGAALVAVLLADVSGISRGETERIWLPLAPWLLIATGGLRIGRLRTAALLALQALVALKIQAEIRTPW